MPAGSMSLKKHQSFQCQSRSKLHAASAQSSGFSIQSSMNSGPVQKHNQFKQAAGMGMGSQTSYLGLFKNPFSSLSQSKMVRGLQPVFATSPNVMNMESLNPA